MSSLYSKRSTLKQELRSAGSSDRRITGSKGQRANAFRLSDIAKIITGRHGGACYDPEWVERYFFAALPHVIGSRLLWGDAVRRWALQWTPILLIANGEEWISDAATKCTEKGRKRYPSSDKLARMLAVDQTMVTKLGLKCIPAVTRPKAVRLTERKTSDADRKRKQRVNAGATPHAQSLAQAKPWLAEGLSRSAWFEKRKAETATNSEACAYLDDFVRIITQAPDEPTTSVIADPPETAVLDDFVRIITVDRSGRFRPHHDDRTQSSARRLSDTIEQLISEAQAACDEYADLDATFVSIRHDERVPW